LVSVTLGQNRIKPISCSSIVTDAITSWQARAGSGNIPSLITMLRLSFSTSTLALSGVLLTASASLAADAAPKLTTHHDSIESISLFAAAPEVATPVGVAVAPDGRVFVQENHTHQRQPDYKGPEKDRILVFEDTNGDGVADKRSVFFEGHVFSTGMVFGPDGHLYVATRSFIGRFLNAATQTKASGEPEILIRCETDGNYPHNGVGGLAIAPTHPETLAFGFGENLGEDYTFTGSDGVKISGGGEGGSTYQCKTDGSGLRRVSTGHWNAFGMTYDPQGNLFSTDNDPNSTPPNRLLHIVPGADYGFEYRYGRSGRHPLVSWYGDTPGTLGMIGALGEAACGVIPYGPDRLLTASWTDNRVDLHPLTKAGASFRAGREPFISGPDNFRPVHFSYSPDHRALYITDWVDLSYPVHGQGRVWKITLREAVDLKPRAPQPASPLTPQQALKQLGDSDPYVRTAAMETLRQHSKVLREHDWKSDSNPVARAHCAVALKRLNPVGHAGIIPDLLADPSPDVRYVGVKWIADQKLAKFRPQLLAVLERDDLSRRDLLAVVAALAEVSGNLKKEFSPAEALLALALDAAKPSSLRALALHGVPIDHPGLTVKVLTQLAQSAHAALQREAVRALVNHPNDARQGPLAAAADNAELDAGIRADAIAGLAPFANDRKPLLTRLAQDKNPIVSAEAARTLGLAGLQPRELAANPDESDVTAWAAMLDALPGKPDVGVGRRLFFHPALHACANCHSMNGRGREVGPDLTAIRQQTDDGRTWLLTHILNPNAEVAPYYRPQMVTTRDGRTMMGFILGKEGQAQAYVGPDGKTFSVLKTDVVGREELPISLMPPSLLLAFSPDEIRDLLAYLLNGNE
jgi:putative membrane-bound dehydrogenase-like protein